MKSGRVEYAPDYKSEKPDYTEGGRLPTIKEMSGSIDLGGRVVFEGDEQRVLSADELRARLEREVIEAAKKWRRAQGEALHVTEVDGERLAVVRAWFRTSQGR
jgi:hypothetical protein